jgi:hypothetical protein
MASTASDDHPTAWLVRGQGPGDDASEPDAMRVVRIPNIQDRLDPRAPFTCVGHAQGP